LEQQDFYNAAIYCRLSKDDESHGESSSISTQKSMLTKCVTERNWKVAGCYVDDGISGTTFERSGFKRMLEDIEDGKINMVVTKDLSRLGRDYLKIGYYTEVYFPENGVRYIAVNDGIDSQRSDNDIAPFKNILNEMYAKDISKKIKSAYKVKFARGDFHGAYAPFGYAKDPNNSKKLVIDEESAETVRMIFRLASQGYGCARIRTKLVENKVNTPAAYLHKLNPKYYEKLFQDGNEYSKYAWSNEMVSRILNNEIYIGDITHYKEISVSFKNKRRQNQPRDKWVKTENTHPPIIDLETWEIIQERSAHRGMVLKKYAPNIFARIVRCADCGRAMWLTPPQKEKTGKLSDRRYYQCVAYRQYGKLKCTMHNVNFKDVYTLVLNDIRQYAKLALEKPEDLLNALNAAESKQKQAESRQTREDQKCGAKRLEELKQLLKRLLEDNVSGRLSNANYATMFAEYQNEQELLTVQVAALNKKLTKLDEEQDNSQKWVELVAKYADLQELDAPIINELCEKILIHEPEKINGKRTQKIEIFIVLSADRRK